MAVTAVRLEVVRLAGFDARLAGLGGGRLTRVAATTYLESDRGIDDMNYQLALAGIGAVRCSSVPGPLTRLRPAIVLDLAPLDETFDAIDVVEVQRIPLADTSAELMHRRLPWLRRSRVARDTCLRLLREEDAVMSWRRILWCSVASMRAARARVRLRPVVFDRAALERHEPRWTYVSDGAIERWAFA